MKKLPLYAIVSAILLSACTEPAPLVSSYNGDSVEIQQSTILTSADPKLPEVVNEAKRICGKTGKNAEYASSRSGPDNYYSTHLFLCL